MTARSPRPYSAGLVALVALLVTSGLATRALSALDWDATAFVGFGESSTPTREYAEERLGAVFLRGPLGHDGKYFFVQANDPWLLEPSENAEVLDFPVYRSQRMLYPMLAGGFGLFSAATIVWGMLVVNVLAMAWGTWGTARLARRLGGSAWWGLAFLGNIGLLFALAIDSADILALGAAVWAIAFFYEGRIRSGIGFLVAAVLTREVMLLVAVGASIWFWTNHSRQKALKVAGVPILVLGVWEAYLRLRLEPDPPGVEAIGIPLAGLARAFPHWLDDPVVLGSGLVVIGFALLHLRRWLMTRSLLGWAFVGFIPLAVVLTAKVWIPVFDFTRAMAPLLTATILLVFVESRTRQQPDEVETASAGVGR